MLLIQKKVVYLRHINQNENKMNYKKLSTRKLLKLNYQYIQNVKCNTTLLWEGDVKLNMKTEINKIRKELETR